VFPTTRGPFGAAFGANAYFMTIGNSAYHAMEITLRHRSGGHITIKISGHPRFPAQVILNGHEYVACQACKARIGFTKEGNCFTHISDAAGLAKIADTLSGQRTIGRLSQACERWIYTTCLCFALDLEEQKQSGFHYQYSNYQVAYSRNLIFEIGGHWTKCFRRGSIAPAYY
jgi:hypothetical protein